MQEVFSLYAERCAGRLPAAGDPLGQPARNKAEPPENVTCGSFREKGGVMSSKTMMIVAVLTVVALAGPAGATFPGRNGRIAFAGATDIFTINPDGRDVRQLTFFGPNGFAYAQSWSSDGRKLVFAATASASTAPIQLWVMNADGSDQRQLLSDPSFLDTYPGFSPDGDTIVFERCRLRGLTFLGGCALYRIKSDGSGLTALTHFSENTDILDITAEYSPDGKTIVFAGFTRGGVISAIYLMNADGSNIRELTAPVLEAWVPDWSPDGSKIAFSTRSSYPPNTINQQIWVINRDGTGLRQLTFPDGSHDAFPSWAPQGNAIAFERDTPDFSTGAIYIISADGSGQKLVFEGLGRTAIDLPPTHFGMIGKQTGQHTARRIQQNAFQPRWGPAPK
jgi:Tol biopolymer transport system component